MKTDKKTDALGIINKETDPQKKLDLLVDHGFIAEASKFVWEFARENTTMFYFDWQRQNLCHPLPRMTADGRSAVYVIITPDSKFDYSYRNGRDIIFELGWESKILGWDEHERQTFVRMVFNQCIIRPLNQWSLRQAEGTARASRLLLPADYWVAREIAALHLVFQLRQADFGHICSYLADIEGFQFAGCGTEKPNEPEKVVEWIVDQLLKLGWTSDRIRKELLEWIWLKVDTHASWLLAVAKAKVFVDYDQARAIAVHQWIMKNFESLLKQLNNNQQRENLVERVEKNRVYNELFLISQFGKDDEAWVVKKLVQQMALGHKSMVIKFITRISNPHTLPLNQVTDLAIEAALAAGNYGIALALMQDSGRAPDRDLIETVRLRSLAVELE